MGHKIFVSYKYADDNVKKITDDWWVTDTVRTYVDKLEEYISDTSEHIYKGEKDGEEDQAVIGTEFFVHEVPLGGCLRHE